MGSGEKYDLSSANVSETLSDSASPADAGSSKDNHGGVTLLEAQTRTRRLFSQAQLFAFSLVYLGTWFSSAM